jgi:hypothetical protein
MMAPQHAWRVGCARCIAILGIFAGLLAAQDARWLRDNNKGNRYEGLMDEPNANRAYDILGFLGFDDKPESIPRQDASVELHVGYCLSESVPVFIEAQELRARTHYLMKSIGAPDDRSWNEFQHWKVSDVLSRNGSDPNDLGVVVRLKSDNEYTEDLAPAFFYPGQPPRRIRQYSLSLRVSRKVASLSYGFVAGTRRKECNYTQSKPCAPRPGAPDASVEDGGIVAMTFDFTDVPAGPVTIHVNGSYANSFDKLFAQYHFYHYPDPKCQ